MRLRPAFMAVKSAVSAARRTSDRAWPGSADHHAPTDNDDLGRPGCGGGPLVGDGVPDLFGASVQLFGADVAEEDDELLAAEAPDEVVPSSWAAITVATLRNALSPTR